MSRAYRRAAKYHDIRSIPSGIFDGRAHTQMYTTLQGTFGGLTAPPGERKNGKDDSKQRRK